MWAKDVSWLNSGQLASDFVSGLNLTIFPCDTEERVMRERIEEALASKIKACISNVS